MIRTLLVDDHALVRDGLRRVLLDHADMQVVGEGRDGTEAVRLAKNLQPDVMILDLSMPGLDGLEATKQIVAERLRTKILVLTMHANEDYAARLLQAGAHGFMGKDAAGQEVVNAVRKIAGGGFYLPQEVSERLPRHYFRRTAHQPSLENLSDRELQVLKRLAEGSMPRQIAQDLHLSVKTIDTYRARLLEKLSLKTTADLIRFALRNGVIEDLW